MGSGEAARGQRVIGVLTTSYPRHRDDPAGSFVARRVHALAATKPVEVIAPCNGPAPPIDGVVDAQSLSVIWVSVGARLVGRGGIPDAWEELARDGAFGRVTAAREGVAIALALLRAAAARVERWAALESHWLVPCGVIGAALAAGRPHRAFAHSADVAWLARLPMGGAWARALIRSGAELSFASAALRARFAHIAGVPPVGAVEPMPPDPRFGACVRRAHPEPLVVGIGRLVPIKGFEHLVLAVARLPESRRPRLVIAGEGPERDRLTRLARRAGVRLELPGVLSADGVASLLATAAVCAIPSVPRGDRHEGMPVVAAEALAMGVPLVASRTGGLAALANHPGVTLCAPGQPDALARALACALAAPPPV